MTDPAEDSALLRCGDDSSTGSKGDIRLHTENALKARVTGVVSDPNIRHRNS